MTAVSTLLDPRFKKLSFVDKTALGHTMQRLTQELQTVIPKPNDPSISSSGLESRPTLQQTNPPALEEISIESIWDSFDQKAKESQVHQTSTVEATREVRRYFPI